MASMFEIKKSINIVRVVSNEDLLFIIDEAISFVFLAFWSVRKRQLDVVSMSTPRCSSQCDASRKLLRRYTRNPWIYLMASFVSFLDLCHELGLLSRSLSKDACELLVLSTLQIGFFNNLKKTLGAEDRLKGRVLKMVPFNTEAELGGGGWWP